MYQSESANLFHVFGNVGTSSYKQNIHSVIWSMFSPFNWFNDYSMQELSLFNSHSPNESYARAYDFLHSVTDASDIGDDRISDEVVTSMFITVFIVAVIIVAGCIFKNLYVEYKARKLQSSHTCKLFHHVCIKSKMRRCCLFS